MIVMSYPASTEPSVGDLSIRLRSEPDMADMTLNHNSQSDSPDVAVKSLGLSNDNITTKSNALRHATVEEADLHHDDDESLPTVHPAQGEAPTERDTSAPQQNDYDEKAPMQMEAKKKKKKKSSKKKKKGETAPNGFEEYYVDPPMTPEEFDEDKKVYNPKIRFASRIQSAIQRYEARRKFNQERRHIWTMYLRYGGIDARPKMFGGIGSKYEHQLDEEDEQGDAETLKAKDFISDDVFEDQLDAEEEGETSKYVVDFDGVARGFFSMQLPGAVPMSSIDKIKLYTGVVWNWLNWLIHHNVCVEYNDQILAARKTCDVATRELWDLTSLGLLLPDKFNKACRAIFTSSSSGSTTTTTTDEGNWGWESDAWGLHDEIDSAEANRIFLTALAALGDDALVDQYQLCNESKEGILVTRSFTTGLEVTAVELPTKATRATYADDAAHGLCPIGRIRARTWYADWEMLPDMTEEEEAALPAKREAARREYVFWIDEAALKHVFVGLKLVVGVKELNFGIFFIDTVANMYTSFVTWLPNELMVGYRKHEYIPPDREKLLSRMNGDAEGQAEGEGDAEGEGEQDVAEDE